MYIDQPRVSSSIAEELIQQSRVGDWTLFRESVQFGFWETPVVQMAEWMGYLEAEDSPEINPESFNEAHEHYRPGFTLNEGETEAQLRIRADAYDRTKSYQVMTRNVGAWDGTRIGGMLLGGLADPINLIPFGGALSKLSQIGKAAANASRISALQNIGQYASVPISSGLTGAGMSAMIGYPILKKKEDFQEEYEMSDYALDIGFGFALGAGLGTFATVGKGIASLDPSTRIGNMFNAVQSIRDNKPVKVTEMPKNASETHSPDLEQPKTFDQQAQESETIFESMASKAQKQYETTKTDPTAGPIIEHVEDALVNLADNMGDMGKNALRAIINCVGRAKS
tara:strand:+ start:3021 stop:4040 length:1020 start_codon:yes stop_codon:yes gene_type:complete